MQSGSISAHLRKIYLKHLTLKLAQKISNNES